MKITRIVAVALCLARANVSVSQAHAADEVPARIAWFGTLDAGLAEAKRSGRPILLISGAPQCLGVPGIW